MAPPVKTVAILVGNPALSSILTMVLAASPGLRVRAFESLAAITTYMRLAPVDLVVVDFDCAESPAPDAARTLYSDMQITPRFDVVALASEVSSAVKSSSIQAGIDEIIVKPMSPKYLLERVIARLHRKTAPRPAPRAADPRPLPSNVVPLFPNGQHQPVY